MPAQVAIIHGWSDTSKSFHKLRTFLASNRIPTAQIWLGDYVSTDDDVRIEDAAKRMQAVIQQKIAGGELTQPFDLIVHSTGGLVAREWLTRFYPGAQGSPVKRIVMLAPANFGSALAHLGKSMIGRVAKGWNNWFQTGAEMLRGLELASPYQWDLACRDLLKPSAGDQSSGPYGPDKVWPFVIVGSRGYQSKLRQFVNERGSDGTVRAAAANLNAVGLSIDFSINPDNPETRVWARRCGPIPFAVLPDRDHGSITDPDANPGSMLELSSRLGALILEALNCNDAQTYVEINRQWAKLSDATADLADAPGTTLTDLFESGNAPEPAELYEYFHIVTRVRDDHGAPVDDYFLEFFSPDLSGDREAVYFHKSVLEDVHVNGQAPSMRALFADRHDLMKGYYPLIRDPAKREVAVSISAAPLGRNIRYFDKTKEGAAGHFVVHNESHDERKDLQARLFRNATHLVEIIIPRQPADKVFGLSQ